VSLVACVECGNQVSDRAPTCPTCGVPQAPISAKAHPSAASASPAKSKRRTHPITWAVFFALVAIVFYYTLKNAQEAKLPSIPIVVEYRPALIGPGFVLMFANRSPQPVTVLATLERPSTTVTKVLELYAPANGRVSVGSREGWIGQHGDHIKLENGNYRPWTGEIP
jgi:hypothetical protein